MAKVEYRFVNEGKVVFKKFARGLAVTFSSPVDHKQASTHQSDDTLFFEDICERGDP